jgi:hypothetical protein
VRYLCLALALILPFSIRCERDGGPGLLDRQAYRNLTRSFGVHPRLLLTGEAQKDLAAELADGRKWLWQRYLDDLPGKVEASRHLPEELDRGSGDLASDLAFAWRMTGSDTLFQAARDYLLELCRREVWDTEYDLLHGHLLMGAALAYDWLYPSLSRDQRTLVAERLGREAEAQYQRIADQRAWYRNQYLQNHAHVNYGGLAFAAAALYGEDPHAQNWLGLCDRFFAEVFRISDPDGTSIEGLSYGNYALEYCLRYAELARTLLGKDYYGSPWVKNYPRYILHSLVPSPAENEWAMTFGDSPRHGNSHGPEPQLFLLASRLGDKDAQLLGRRLIGLRQTGLSSASWWSILWFDPRAGETDPRSFPTFRHFDSIDQVMLRSAWEDTAATLVGIKCGPFMCKGLAREFGYDLGCAHGHPDAGSFQIYAHGRFLAIDPGYTMFKLTGNHNTLLVKGQGQLGEQEPWFAAGEALAFGQAPRILETRSEPEYDYVLGDISRAYHPALGLTRCLRHYLFIKPDILLVADELTLDSRGVLYAYPADSLETGGALRSEGGYVLGTQGRASFIFQGAPGNYSVGVSYLDNNPGAGSYSLTVGGDTVYAWKDTVQITDTHLEEVPEVSLAPGDTVAFQAWPMGEGGKLVKMIVFSREAQTERKVSWLLHLEPGAELQRVATRIEARTGGMCLDVYPIAPGQRNHDWGLYNVRAGMEFKQTMRLAISPVFTDSNTVMLNLLHARKQDSPPLDRFTGSLAGSLVSLHWFEKNRPVSVSLNLSSGVVTLQKEK